MKKEKIIALSVIFLIVVGFLVFRSYSRSNSDSLCVYEIPNHIKFECPAGNDTRVVNFFEITLFRYNNTISQDCVILEELSDYGYRYEISKCDESIPFNIFS